MKQIDDERGVHGGAYGVRPNVHESMVFLRKMFSHQGGAGVSKLLSPPDGRLRKFIAFRSLRVRVSDACYISNKKSRRIQV